MLRTIARHAFPLFQGMAIGTLATATLGFAALQGDAFESDPRPTVRFEQEASTPVPRVNMPFAYKGQDMPTWCYEDMPCFDGTLQDTRRWVRLTSGLADALAEGEHPRLVPDTRVLGFWDCYFAARTKDIACSNGYAANLRVGKRWSL